MLSDIRLNGFSLIFFEAKSKQAVNIDVGDIDIDVIIFDIVMHGICTSTEGFVTWEITFGVHRLVHGWLVYTGWHMVGTWLAGVHWLVHGWLGYTGWYMVGWYTLVSTRLASVHWLVHGWLVYTGWYMVD